jgi:hypothetical protein
MVDQKTAQERLIAAVAAAIREQFKDLPAAVEAIGLDTADAIPLAIYGIAITPEGQILRVPEGSGYRLAVEPEEWNTGG